MVWEYQLAKVKFRVSLDSSPPDLLNRPFALDNPGFPGLNWATSVKVVACALKLYKVEVRTWGRLTDSRSPNWVHLWIWTAMNLFCWWSSERRKSGSTVFSLCNNWLEHVKMINSNTINRPRSNQIKDVLGWLRYILSLVFLLEYLKILWAC